MPTPVVLVHGLGTSARRTWQETGWVDLLTDTGRLVVAPDLLGHGVADKPDDPAAYGALEDHLLASFPEGPVAAVGFSLGASLLLRLASREPTRFVRLVVAGVGDNLFRQDERPELLAEMIESTEVPDHPVARFFHQLADEPDVDRRALVALLRRPAADPPLRPEDLGTIRCPVLVVLGDQDFAGPAAPLVDALPNATLVTLRNTDHFATPKSFAFLDAALRFLESSP